MNPVSPSDAIALRHGRTTLVVHVRKRSPGAKLLLLHSLRSSSTQWTETIDAWPGSVFALDFSGHGESRSREGGVYSPELFLADADAALDELGEACVVGTGLGAYVALLLAGARAGRVPAALLFPGVGLAGGGSEPPPQPDRERFESLLEAHRSPLPKTVPDPRVLMADTDIRPANYAAAFGARAAGLLLAEDGDSRPPWWEGLRPLGCAQVVTTDLGDGLRELWELQRVSTTSVEGGLR